MASVDQVFAIPELLEMILLRLPELDLLLSQRVNTTWRSLTKTSPHLQRKLFYKVDVCDLASISDINWNPLISTLKKYVDASIPKTEIGTNDHTKASWSDMFLTRPAVREIEVDFVASYVEDDMQPSGVELAPWEQIYGPVEDPNGVTMGGIRSTEWIDKEVVAVTCARGTSATLYISVYKELVVSLGTYSYSRFHQTNK